MTALIPTNSSPSTSSPSPTAADTRAHDAFTALMGALSRPGKIYEFSSANAFEAVAEALLDLETTFFTPDTALEGYCRALGARFTLPERADYLLFPALTEAHLPLLDGVTVGTMLYPDTSATLVLGASFEGDNSLRLQGPGILLEENIALGGHPAAFWILRNAKVHFPLGWDVVLLEQSNPIARVMGLPRSTKIEAQ